MTRKMVVLLFVAFSILSAYFGEGRAGTLQDVKARGRLIAGVRTDLPPFGFLDKKGVNKGYDIDIARSLAKELLGKEDGVTFVPITSASGITFLDAKKVDVLFGGMLISEPRLEGIDCSVPYFTSGHLILARNKSRIAQYQDLAGKNVATILDSTGDRAVRELTPRAKRTVFNYRYEALGALKNHRVDAFIDDAVVIIHFQRRNPDLKIAGFQPFAPVSYGVGLKKGDEEWIGFVNATLTKLKETGRYEKLSEKWLAEAMELLLGFEKPINVKDGKK